MYFMKGYLYKYVVDNPLQMFDAAIFHLDRTLIRKLRNVKYNFNFILFVFFCFCFVIFIEIFLEKLFILP